MGTSTANRIVIFGRMIKFSHTIFALPFAMAAVVLAYQEGHPFIWQDLFWIIVAMTSARSAAMGFNRMADAALDAKNPRTAIREIPSGLLSKTETVVFILISSVIFLLSAAMLSPLCFRLSFPVLFFLMFYSFTKRFTRYCHLFLGAAISLAPIGAFLAITDTISSGIIFLCLALMSYIAGFDILYACQDIEFDRENALFSIPSSLGPEKAMLISSFLHVTTFLFLLAMYFRMKMHPVFLIFLILIGVLLIIEHRLVRPDDLTRINIAFFHINSVISVMLFTGVLVQALVR